MSTTILTDEQKAQFVTDIADYGTGFVAPLFAVVESIEQAVLQSEQVQARMEAYAAAKVREALEQAIAICQAEGDEWGSDSVEIEKNYAHAARDRIRALIPPLPGPVEPTT